MTEEEINKFKSELQKIRDKAISMISLLELIKKTHLKIYGDINDYNIAVEMIQNSKELSECIIKMTEV